MPPGELRRYIERTEENHGRLFARGFEGKNVLNSLTAEAGDGVS